MFQFAVDESLKEIEPTPLGFIRADGRRWIPHNGSGGGGRSETECYVENSRLLDIAIAGAASAGTSHTGWLSLITLDAANP